MGKDISSEVWKYLDCKDGGMSYVYGVKNCETCCSADVSIISSADFFCIDIKCGEIEIRLSKNHVIVVYL